MGVSTDAILFWGYCWAEERSDLPGASIYRDAKPRDEDKEEEEEEDEEEEWPERLLVARGIANPYTDAPAFEPDWSAYRAKNAARFEAWHQAQSHIRAEFGCDIGSHAHIDYSMPYVCVDASYVVAQRGCPEPIDAQRMRVGDDWPERLRAFIEALDIVPPEGQEPGWWLVSYWA